MSTTLLWGIITNAEIKKSTKGTIYGTLAVSSSFKTKENEIKTITNYVSVLDQYNLEFIHQGFVGKGDCVVLDVNATPQSYVNKEGKTVATINYVANKINNINIAQRVALLQQQAQQMQQVAQPSAVQQAQPMMNQQAFNANVQQVQPTQPTAGNTNPWELDL